ncbi:MAG: ABC transporter permease [Bryobacteraceae bacterium]
MRAALRLIRYSPGTVLAASLLLAAGIGAAITIHSVIDAVLFRPTGLRDPEQLAAIYAKRETARGFPYSWISYADWRAVRERRDTIDDIALWFDTDLAYREREGTRRIRGQVVTPNFFRLTGAPLTTGRGFVEKDGAVAVVDEAFCGGCLGRTLTLNGQPFTVVGVARRGFPGVTLLRAPQVWVPLSQYRAVLKIPDPERIFTRPDFRIFAAAARLRPGVSVETANESLRTLSTNEELRLTALPLRDVRVGIADQPNVERYLFLIAGLVAMLLVLTAASAGGLLLAHTSARQRDIAIRTALGATRGALLRQSIAESGVPAVLGGAGGIIVASVLAPFAGRLAAMQTGLPVDPVLDARTMVFAALACTASAALAGVAPALGTTVAVTERNGTPRPSRLRTGLVAGQFALCTTLGFGAILLAGSMRELAAVDTGYGARTVAAMTIDMSGSTHRAALQRDVISRVAGAAGVDAASLSLSRPLSRVHSAAAITWESGLEPIASGRNWVSPAYFDTVGLPLVRGRAFREDDQAVAIVSETLARQAFGERDPVGRQIRIQGGETLQIVGVARDAKYRSPAEAATPYFYQPLFEADLHQVTLLVRTAGAPARWLETVRREIAAIDRDLPVFDASTYEEQERLATVRQRTAAWLSGLIAAIAAGLAAAGLFGLMAAQTTARTREFGVRLAVGASRGDVAGLVFGGAAKLAAAGAALGAVGCVWVARVSAWLLFGVTPADPGAAGVLVLSLSLIVAAAAWVPARRATRVDPASALRAE